MTDIEEVYALYFDDVFRYVLRLSNDRQIAEDVTGETFFKAIGISARRQPEIEGAVRKIYHFQSDAVAENVPRGLLGSGVAVPDREKLLLFADEKSQSAHQYGRCGMDGGGSGG